MKHRTSRGVAALALGAVLLLSACGSDDPTDDGTTTPGAEETASTTSPEDLALLEAVTVEGEAGEEPTLEFETPFEVSGPASLVLEEGTGADLVEGQRVTMDYVFYDGTGERLGSTWEFEDPQSFTFGDPMYSLLTEPLTGQKVGARLLLANPQQDGTVLNLIEIVAAEDIPERAEGETVEPAEGLPTVTLGEDGAPSVEIPEGYEAPDELVVQTLIQGDGPEVTEDQSVTAHYTGWTLDGNVFDSSWERGSPTDFPLSGVIAGWTQGISGQTVGSQVLLVIPSDMGYGEQGTPDGSIPPDSPLVFVVDILAAQ